MDERIEQAILFITQYYYKPLVLDEICESVGLSKFHFHRMFRSNTGMTPIQFWHQIRLQHAAHFALQYPKSKQLEIAFMCGFVSPAIFARAFQKEYKMSLGQFRKASLSEDSYQIEERFLPIALGYDPSFEGGYFAKVKRNKKSGIKGFVKEQNKELENSFSIYLDASIYSLKERKNSFMFWVKAERK